MDKMYGLAVVLIIFEGIVTIIGSGIGTSEPFKVDVVRIVPHELNSKTREYSTENGDVYLQFGTFNDLETFFEKNNDQLKKVKVEMEYIHKSDDLRRAVNKNVIGKYANKIENMKIICFDDEGLWDELLLSDAENRLSFPEVKRFQYEGNIKRNKFKLDSIFPKLEYFALRGSIKDTNCLQNVKTLKDLSLFTKSIPEHHLNLIFANNPDMKKIALNAPNGAEIKVAIAEHLTKLETLMLTFPTSNFLYQTNDQVLYKLLSVKHFYIYFNSRERIGGNISFYMPNLKNLRLYRFCKSLDCTEKDKLPADRAQDKIKEFINNFKEFELDSVELNLNTNDSMDIINEFNNIKEISIIYINKIQFAFLLRMLENFDKNSNLQTLKLFECDEDIYRNYKNKMTELNDQLKKSEKSTWNLSIETNKERIFELGQKYLMFKRQPST